MKHAILGLFAATLLAAPTGFAASGKKMICTETGKEVKSCCCTVKNGQFVCKFTNKPFDKCYCESK
jgi:DTW domain-containing protein YfiP